MAEQIIIPGVGDIIAEKYAIKTELGRGAYGVVFGCEQVDIGRYVAVKTLLPQAFLQGEVVSRFHREAQLISRLDHPNVIRLFDYGVHDGLLYMAVEFVSGETLASLIKKSAPMDSKTVAEISLQILAGLEHAHSKGIIHRDLKPENIIVIEREGRFEAKILDFGISKLVLGDDGEKNAMNTLTQDGTVLGTPHYMSPENIVGDPCDHRTDIYGLGVMMYEMVSGTHPFDASSPSAVFIKHLTAEIPLLEPEIQESVLGATIFHAMEKQPEDRIQSAAEMKTMLLSDTYVPLKRTQNEGAKKRKAILFGLLFGAVITLLLGLSVLFLASPTEKEIVEEKPIVVEAPIEENEGELVFDEPLEFEEPTAPELIEALVIAKTLRNQASSRALSSSDSLSKRETSKLRGKKEKKEEKKAVKTKENPKTTTVRFTSIPSNAVVKINNVRVGKTPLSRSYSDPSVSLNVSFSHIGYTTSRVRFSPEKRTKLHVKLKQSRLKIE